jgi:hypothetical protein
MNTRASAAVFVVVLVLAIGAIAPSAQTRATAGPSSAPHITTPKEEFGFDIGDD